MWEWCQDGYGSYLFPARPGDGLRSPATSAREDRMNRGGSWTDLAKRARSAFRNHVSPDEVSHDLGVRPARTLER